ncbi:hypothetical protein EV175_000920 [Coemansia sp. RSA 1933]|nr:hypothetical protein EV175_000920 [Coemansia sp. RSA 1933]
MSSTDSLSGDQAHYASGPGTIEDEPVVHSEDDAIFVPEGSYAQLDDAYDEIDEASTNQPSDTVEIEEHNNIDLDRILDERISADIARRQSQEKATTDHAEQNANIDAGHTSTQLASPIEVNINSSGQKAMPAEHVRQIKDIMAGIQLSDAAIPEWAKRVPEQAWMPRRKQQPSHPSSPCFTDLPDPDHKSQ